MHWGWLHLEVIITIVFAAGWEGMAGEVGEEFFQLEEEALAGEVLVGEHVVAN